MLTVSSKYKIPQYQNGRAYLTSHRICYVDNAEPRKYSVAVDLKDVQFVDYYVRGTVVIMQL
jgi:ESCRT-II complex subunit VPS36